MFNLLIFRQSPVSKVKNAVTPLTKGPDMVETTLCDFCGNNQADILYTNAQWQLPGLDAFAMVQCKNCGLIYLNPRPSPDEMDTYYPQEYTPFRRAIRDERSPLLRWMRRRKLIQRRRMVEKYSGRKSGWLLDVGCATGIFLNEMALAGWQVRGVEPVKSAVKYARKQFGLEIFHGYLENAPYPPASFDVITFWDVLEHTFSPLATLSKTAELLRPGGLVTINIPNWESPDRHWFGAHWIGLDPPRHLYVFPPQVLEKMLYKTGFEVLDWVCFFPSYFSFAISLERTLINRSPQLAKPLGRILNFPGVRFLFEPYFTVANWLRRGGVISVFARKKSEH